jgi:small subunit ribosomal protein S20
LYWNDFFGGSPLANIKSQIKRNRQNEKRRLRNRVVRGTYRAAVRTARTAIQSGDADASKEAVLAAISRLDKAAQKGVIHKNNAARRKSRLMKALAAVGTE